MEKSRNEGDIRFNLYKENWTWIWTDLTSRPHTLYGKWIYTPEHLEVREGRKLGKIKESSAVGQFMAGANPDLHPNNPFVIVCDDDTFYNEVDGHNIWDSP